MCKCQGCMELTFRSLLVLFLIPVVGNEADKASIAPVSFSLRILGMNL